MNREYKTGEIQAGKPAQQVPWLEWLAAGIGLFLVLGIFGVIGWQALNGATVRPVITVTVENVTPVAGGYRVLFRAQNTAGEAAAQVEVEGKVSTDSGEEVSQVVIDYVPGHSDRRGGLFFTRDPSSGTLTVRAIGFAEP